MSKISELVEEHQELREKGVNLIASENYLSKRVRDVLSSDLAGRYHSDYYGGSEYTQKLVIEVEELAKELFDVKHAFVKPVSGNICDLNVLFSFTEPGDEVAMMDFENGGYPLGLKKFKRERRALPAHQDTYEIYAGGCEEVYNENIPLTILGASYIPFPHPVEEIDGMRGDDSTLVYDGSHVLGLIATETFQSPLKEGGDVLIGSTHKTFYGPQGGLILTNSSQHAEEIRKYQDIDLDTGIGLIDNPHVNRIAALGLAIEEMLEDRDYGKNVVENAEYLARSLDENGVPMRFSHKGYTESHQIFFDMNWEQSEKFCHALEKEDIFVDISGRIGVAEVTHRGIDREELDHIAETIAEVYNRVF